MLPFNVAAKYARGPEKLVAKFDLQDDAKTYIHRKLEQDMGLRISVTYLLYDMGELMESFEPGQASSVGAEGSAGMGSSGGGQQQNSGLRPSPLQTAPRPSGMPPSSFRDLIKEQSDDKKK
jgi:hypothetical protein